MRLDKILLVTLLLFVVLICFPGIYYEDMTDVYHSVFSKGLLTSEPIAVFNNYGSHFVLDILYMYLSILNENIDWFGLLNILFLWLAISNIIYCIFYNYEDKKWQSFFIILLISPFLLKDILYLNYNKTSLYLLFSSSWVLIKQWETISKKIVVLNVFLFLVGLFLRPLCMFIIFALFIPSYLINSSFLLQISSIKKSIILFMVGSIVIFFSFKSYNSTDKIYADFAEYKSSIWDNGQPMNTLQLKTAKDSLLYESITQFYMPELSFIAPEKFKEMGIYKAHSPLDVMKVSIKELGYKINKAKQKWMDIFFDLPHTILFSLILVILLLSATNIKSFSYQVFVLSWFMIFVFLLSIIAKIEVRILYPVLVVLLILLAHYSSFLKDKFSLQQKVLIGIIALSMLHYYYELSKVILLNRDRQTAINNFLFQQSNTTPKKTIVIDAFSINILGNRVLSNNINIKALNWITIDPAYFVFYNEYIDKRKEICGSNDYLDCITYMQKNKDKFYFIFFEDRNKLIEKYLKVMYNKDVKFKRDKLCFINSGLYYGQNFYCYTIP